MLSPIRPTHIDSSEIEETIRSDGLRGEIVMELAAVLRVNRDDVLSELPFQFYSGSILDHFIGLPLSLRRSRAGWRIVGGFGRAAFRPFFFLSMSLQAFDEAEETRKEERDNSLEHDEGSV